MYYVINSCLLKKWIFSGIWIFWKFLFTLLTINYICMYFNHPVIFSVVFRPIIFVYLSLYSLFIGFSVKFIGIRSFPPALVSSGLSLSLSLFVLNEKKDSWLHVVGSSLKKQRKRERREESSGQVWPKIKFIAPSSLFILRLHPLWNVLFFRAYGG